MEAFHYPLVGRRHPYVGLRAKIIHSIRLTSMPFQRSNHIHHVPTHWNPATLGYAGHLDRLPRLGVCHLRSRAVHSTNRTYLAREARRRTQHPDDVYSNARSRGHGCFHCDPVGVKSLLTASIRLLTLSRRPGTDWTSWATFAVAGVMQGILLAMCLVWKARQNRLGIDDFGNPILPAQDERAPLLSNGH